MFTDTQLDRLSALIEARTGLNTFARYRQSLIMALQQDVIPNLDAYTWHLEMLDHSHPVWQALLNDLTIGETYFMRDQQQISLLREYVLPSIIQQKRNTNRQIRIWSAGCATGEEVYTLAILLYELLPDRDQWDIRVLGTDITVAAIQTAQRGLYKAWSFRNTSEHFQQVYFVLRGDQFEIRPELRHMVRFEQANLVSASMPMQDLIVCRNVLFYFTKDQSSIAEQRLLQTLVPQGWLLLSPAETLRHTRQQFKIHTYAQTVVFQKQPNEALPTPSRAQRNLIPLGQAYQAAVEALQNRQWAAAEVHLAQLTNMATPQTASLRASVALNKGEWDVARSALEEALHYDPFWPDAHYLMSLWHMQHEDWLAAYTSLRAAIYSRPRFALAYLLKGDLMMKQGDYDRASRAWKTARQLAQEVEADIFLSDIADVTAGQMIELVNHRLD